MGNKAHLRPHRKKRQASRTTGLLLVILFIALVALAVAMVASGHALPAGRIFPLRRGRCARASRRARCVPDRGVIRGTSRLPIGQSVPGPDAAIPCTVRRSRGTSMIRNMRGIIPTLGRWATESKQVVGTNSLDGEAGLRSRERASLGATLRATGANNLQGIRTRMNSGQGRVRGHGPI